jgi:hypothetical protein
MTTGDWKFNSARAAIGSLQLEGPNAQLADYWLSLWRGDRAPQFVSFDPKRLPGFQPALAVLAVMPHVGFHCIRAGNYIQLATGVDMTGKDYLAWTAPGDRHARLDNMTRIALGTVICAQRTVARGKRFRKELIAELALPFAGICEDGTRRVLFHTNWRPVDDENIMGLVPRAEIDVPGIIASATLTPLAAPDAAAA